MSINLNDKEKRTIVKFIEENIDEQLKQFPYAKYPVEPLQQWKRIFSEPAAVPLSTVKDVLSWQFGSWKRKSLATPHHRVMSTYVKQWDVFSQLPLSIEEMYSYWESEIQDWQYGFDATSMILYVIRPDQLELCDRHRLKAMNELLSMVNFQDELNLNAISFKNIQNYTEFFRMMLMKMKYGPDSRVKLDRFLKAYGNRAAYSMKNRNFQTKAPTITEASWESPANSRFDLSKIKLRANVDILFSCLLQTLERDPDLKTTLTIGEITDLIPIGTGGVCNPASYKYALISMFGRQKGREYFDLDDSISKEFTQQANQSSRDLSILTRHLTTQIKIRPNFIK
jgi:hypothetical protein